MKDFNDILQQFDGLTDLPVSEELVGAYIEGNLDEDQMNEANKILKTNVNTSMLLASMEELDNDDNNLGISKDFNSEDTNLALSLDSNINLMQKGMGEYENFGYEPNHSETTFDSNIYQGNQPSCAIRSQEIIMRDYGISISQEELIKYATEQGWYSSDPIKGGTPLDATGNLLDAMGIETKRYDNATIFDIIAELRAGHRVIVCLDANELWIKKESKLYKRIFGEIANRLQDKMDDLNGALGANHALIVAGVNVDPSNPSDMRVVLIDSGTGEVCVEYDFPAFKKAWDDSHCHMVTTTQAAPFQYNYVTHQMEPSNFQTDFMPSMVSLPAGLHNQFELSDSYFEEFGNIIPEYDWNHVVPFWESWDNEGEGHTTQMLAQSSSPSHEKDIADDETESSDEDDALSDYDDSSTDSTSEEDSTTDSFDSDDYSSDDYDTEQLDNDSYSDSSEEYEY